MMMRNKFFLGVGEMQGEKAICARQKRHRVQPAERKTVWRTSKCEEVVRGGTGGKKRTGNR